MNFLIIVFNAIVLCTEKPLNRKLILAGIIEDIKDRGYTRFCGFPQRVQRNIKNRRQMIEHGFYGLTRREEWVLAYLEYEDQDIERTREFRSRRWPLSMRDLPFVNPLERYDNEMRKRVQCPTSVIEYEDDDEEDRMMKYDYEQDYEQYYEHEYEYEYDYDYAHEYRNEYKYGYGHRYECAYKYEYEYKYDKIFEKEYRNLYNQRLENEISALRSTKPNKFCKSAPFQPDENEDTPLSTPMIVCVNELTSSLAKHFWSLCEVFLNTFNRLTNS